MNRLDLLLLQDIARKQGKHQQHDQDEKSPGAEELLFSGLRSIWNSSSATDSTEVSEYKRSTRVPSSGSSESAALPAEQRHQVSHGTIAMT